MKKIKSIVATVVSLVFMTSLASCEGEQKKIYDYSPEKMSTEFSEEYSSMKACFAEFCGVKTDEISFGYRTDFALTVENPNKSSYYAYCAKKTGGKPFYVKIGDKQEWIYVSDDMVNDSRVRYFDSSEGYEIDGHVYSEDYIIKKKRLDEETESGIGYTTDEIVELIVSEVRAHAENLTETTEGPTGIDKIGFSQE